ncbi:MAG: NAD(P)-dependent oxidoreductase, partial [Aeromicrobium sp.]
MKICLTGAAGFIGLHIGAALTAAGHEVVGVDALLPQVHGELSQTPEGLVVADIRTTDLDSLLKGVDVVCHQAAVVGNGVDAQDFPDYAAHNDFGTAVLLAAMARAGVDDLVLASSMVVYGD